MAGGRPHLHHFQIIVGSRFEPARSPQTFCKIEGRLRRAGTLRVLRQEALEGRDGRGIAAGLVKLLRRAVEHLFLLFGALAVGTADLVEIGQIFLGLVAQLVDALQTGEGVFRIGRFGCGRDHRLVVFDRLVVLAAVGIDQRQLQQRLRIIVVALHAQQGEEAFARTVILPRLDIGPAQLEQGLGIERRVAVRAGHLAEDVDLLLVVAHQAIGHGRLQHGIQVLRIGIGLPEALIDGGGIGIFALHEAGVAQAQLGVVLVLGHVARDVQEAAEIIFSEIEFAALEVVVGLVVERLRIVGGAAEIFVEQQVAQNRDRFVIALVAVAALGLPETRQVAQALVLPVFDGRLQQRFGGTVALPLDQLECAEEGGLLQVGRRFVGMFPDGAQRPDSRRIVFRKQEGGRHVVVDDVILAAVGIGFHELAELRNVGVHVERQLGEVEEGVFPDDRVEIALRRGLEGIQGGNLVLGFQVAVGGVVPGVLAQLVFLSQHVRERLDGGGPGLEAVGHDAGKIVVLPAELRAALGVDVEILAGGYLVALLIIGFREDTGQAALHLLVQLVVKRDALADHVVIILEHQLALHGEIVRHFGELVAGSDLLEEGDRLGELLADVVDVSFVIGCGQRVLGAGRRQDLGEAVGSVFIAARAQVAVGFLEGETRTLGLVEMVAVDGVVHGQGFGITARVEIAGGQGLLDHRLLRGIGKFAAEGVDQAFRIDFVQGDGAHHLVGFNLRFVEGAEGFLAQFRESFLRRIIGAAVVEFAGRFEAVGMLPVLHLAPKGRHRQEQQQGHCAVSEVWEHAFHHSMVRK